MRITGKQRILDGVGSAVDGLFLAAPRLAAPFRPRRGISREAYEAQIDFYIDSGYTRQPETFFSFPETAPAWTLEEERPCFDGNRQVISFVSGYEAQNPGIRQKYHAFSANRTGWLVRWIHPDAGRKTVLCLHGYMLGEPNQAERMFGVKKLFAAGLDVALYITPFHWRRAPAQKRRRGIFLQPDNVPMTCECFGQAMYDLESTRLVLQDMGAGDIGLIGASLGGYNAALYVALSGQVHFAALIVPAVSLDGPLGPGSARLPFCVDRDLQKKIQEVWTFHAPCRLQPRLSVDQLLVVASRGDRLCPFDNVKMLCERWKITNCRFLTGGHWLIFNNKARGRAWYDFLQDRGFLSLPGR